jgi:hypothetical protein
MTYFSWKEHKGENGMILAGTTADAHRRNQEDGN